jgi:putative oxidoreductase
MLVAGWTVHRRNGFFIVKEGWEYNLVLATAAVAVAVAPGRLSLDHVLLGGTRLAPLLHGWSGLSIALGLGLAGGVGQLMLFYRPPAKV